MTAVLVPHLDQPAFEERFAAWQARSILGSGGCVVRSYDPADDVRDIAGAIEDDDVVVVTDSVLLPSPNLVPRLVAILHASDADAVIPMTNITAQPQQRMELPPYLTLRDLQTLTAAREAEPMNLVRVTWDDSDPVVYACRTAFLDDRNAVAAHALRGADVAISTNDFVHRWTPMRTIMRDDLFERIPTTARSILDLGCGEAVLGAALKQRQKCRVVGIEIDRQAAAVARKRIDDVYCGDLRELIDILDEQFDRIIGGDVIEHLADPWSTLSSLRRLCAPNGRLLLSLPNIASGAIIHDLLAGNFDYVYMGLTCAGHLRFFTRTSIEQMMAMTGWRIETIERQEISRTFAVEELLRMLDQARIPYARDELTTTGFYVTAVPR